MTLAVDITHRLGKFRLDARFATEGGLTALFGRSGAGKSSIINVIAGLIRPETGRVTIDEEPLLDTAHGIFVPAHKRRVGYVFQEGRLFPHLTVRQNLLYGRWFAPAALRRDDLDRVVELLGLGATLERRPGKLSGGEKQRVAIGRALLANPRLLLMDEPLASLDEARKAEILPYIERLRDEGRVPIVYVSHSVAEVVRLASTVVLLAEGCVAAVGATAQVMQRIDLPSLACDPDAGAVIEATVAAHDARFGLTELSSRAGTWRLPTINAAVGEPLRLHVHARDVMLATTRPADVSALNVMQGVVAEVRAGNGPTVDIRLDCSGEALTARLTRYSAERLALLPGSSVFALIKTVAFDRGGLGGPVRTGQAADASDT